MPSLLRQLIGGTKRRIKRGLQEQKTFRLYEAGVRLLGRDDYDRVSVAAIAREAGCSVGAFYERFRNKDAFLDELIRIRLRRAADRSVQELYRRRWKRAEPARIARAIVEDSVQAFHGHGAGVIKAALKRGHLDLEKMKPLLAYRTAVSDRAVQLLAHQANGVGDRALAVRAMVQMIHATALDALLQDQGPLRAGRTKMVETMTAMLVRSLGLSGAVAAAEAEEEPSVESADEDDPPIEMPIEGGGLRPTGLAIKAAVTKAQEKGSGCRAAGRAGRSDGHTASQTGARGTATTQAPSLDLNERRKRVRKSTLNSDHVGWLGRRIQTTAEKAGNSIKGTSKIRLGF